MTNPVSAPIDALRTLIDELERYDGWLSALDARRDATPAHVLDRVRSDYDGRQRGVRERIASHLTPLREEESQLAGREADVGRSLAERQDELAEVELRTLVGEFAPDEGERRVQQTAAVVRGLENEREALTLQLTELRALLARAAPPPAPDPAVAATSTAPAVDAPVADPTAADAPAADVAAGTERASPSSEPTEPPAADAGHPVPARDDEGFVGTGERLDSLAASLGGSMAQATAPVAASSQEKTLRCGECGEMNYPTEWYCERCGGELAAM